MVKSWSRRHLFTLATGASLAPLQAAPPVSKYSLKVLADKPVGYWKLGDATGTMIADSSGKGHHGACQGTPKLAEPGCLKYDTDGAVKFDGQRSWIEIPDSADFSVATSGKGLSVEVWVRPDLLVFPGESDDPLIHWLGKGQAGSFEWAFRFYSKNSTRPNRMSAYAWNPEGALGSGAYVEEALKPGEWIHLVACFDAGDKTKAGTGVSLYKNGVLRGSPATSNGALYSAFSVSPVHGSAPLCLGTRDKTNFLTGALDEVAIYPRVLSDTEVRGAFPSGLGTLTAVCWPHRFTMSWHPSVAPSS